MRILLQRSKDAQVKVEGKVTGKSSFGLVAFVGFTHDDTESDIDAMIDKMIHLRIFDDENGVMNKSLLDVGGSILVISQFTLYADTKKGRRPSYHEALRSSEANILYELFCKKLKEMGITIETGEFGSDMQVTLTNMGPVTILLER